MRGEVSDVLAVHVLILTGSFHQQLTLSNL